MEPVGLAVGIVGLAGLFNSCLEALEKLQSYRSFATDSQALDAQFGSAKLQLERWGEAVGFTEGKLSQDHNPILDDKDVMPAVKDLLYAINSICQTSGTSPQLSVRAGAGPATNNPLLHDQAPRTFGSSSKSTRRKLAWALRGKSERTGQVNLLGELVRHLRLLVPPDGRKGTSWIHGQNAPAGDGSLRLQGADPRFDDVSPRSDQDPGNFSNRAWPAELQQLLARIDVEVRAESRRALHNWLLGRYSPNETYDDSILKRLEGTCDWILDRPIFQRWLSPDRDTATLKLWINAPAGFGKTILCARLVQRLSSQLGTPIASFFFSSNCESRGDPFVAIRSWTSQIVASDPAALDLARDRWETDHDQVATRATVVQLFHDLLHAVPGCTLVADGLDECAPTGESGVSVARFMETIRRAVSTTRTSVIMVSRDESEIRRALMDDEIGRFDEYKIQPADVRADTALYSRTIVDRKLYNKSEIVRAEISEKMSDRCEGQFLWLRLQEDCLRKGMNKKQLERTVAETPTGLERLYERNWQRMESFQDRERNRAFRLLRLATFAIRPLTVCEITVAVLLDENSDEFPVDELPDSVDEDYLTSEIVDLCGSLVEVRSNPETTSVGTRTIHLAHFSIKQYLLRTILPSVGLVADEKLRASHEAIECAKLAKLCLRYITFPQIWQEVGQDQYDALAVSFRDYAAASWYVHAGAAGVIETDMMSRMTEFLDVNNPCWDAWRNWYDEKDEKQLELVAAESQPPGPLYYALKLDLLPLAINIIERRGLNVSEERNLARTALGIASEKGHVQVVRMVLAAGADIIVTRENGSTPLHSASFGGHIEIVKLLHEKGADLEKTSKYGVTPLNAAAKNGHIEVVRLLIALGVNIAAGDKEGWTPLNSAAVEGHVEVVSLLSNNGASVNSANKAGWSPLHAAAANGHLNLVKLLLAQGAYISAVDEDAATPLYSASMNGHVEVVKLLIDLEADITAATLKRWTPLNAAAHNGHVELVRLLIDHGADIAAAENHGGTPLYSASVQGHVEVLRCLVDHGADFNAATIQGWTPLNAAAYKGHIHAAKLLIDYGADIKAANKGGATPLYSASLNGHVDLAKLLIDREADIAAVTIHKWTPLNAAAHNGHVDVVKLLIDHGVDIPAAIKEGATPLLLASVNGHSEVVKLLIDHGADLTTAQYNGWTPLNAAACNGHIDVARLLIDYGADITAANADGATPLYSASLNGHIDLVMLLIDHEADITAATIQKWTPLSAAAHNGHVDVVKLLIDYGADITAATINGTTPLIAAATGGFPRLVEFLLCNESLPCTRRDSNGRTALFHAARCGHEQVVRLLAEECPLQLHTSDRYDSLPLHAAVRNGHETAVEYLLTVGETEARTDGFGKTLHWWASKSGNERILALVLRQTSISRTIDTTDAKLNSCPVVYKASAWWCDICTMCIQDKTSCYTCSDCDDGYFVICSGCSSMDMKCRGKFHNWVVKKTP